MQVKIDSRLGDIYYTNLAPRFKGKTVTVFKGRKYPKGTKAIIKDIDYYDVYRGTLLYETIVYFVTDVGYINSNNCIWE